MTYQLPSILACHPKFAMEPKALEEAHRKHFSVSNLPSVFSTKGSHTEMTLEARRGVRVLAPIDVPHKGFKYSEPATAGLAAAKFDWLSPVSTLWDCPSTSAKDAHTRRNSGQLSPKCVLRQRRLLRRSASTGNLYSMAVAPMHLETSDMREQQRQISDPPPTELMSCQRHKGGKRSSMKLRELRPSSGDGAVSLPIASRGDEPIKQVDVEMCEDSAPNAETMSQSQPSTTHPDWDDFCLEGGRSVKEVRDRSTGFSGAEIAKVHQAFVRFAPTDMLELDREALLDVCIHVGFFGATEDIINNIASDTSDFSTFSFEEVVEILEKYASREQEIFTTAFEKHCKPSFNVMEINQVLQILRSLGLTVKRSMLMAMLSKLGITGGELPLEGFLDLLAIYCVTEGFENEEIERARRVFQDYASEKGATMKLSALTDALMDFLGPMAMVHLKEAVVQKLSVDREAFNSKSRNLLFHEFLIWTRRIRETSYRCIDQCFQEVGGDVGGTVSRDQLHVVLSKLGFTLFSVALDELLSEAGASDVDKLDFDLVVSIVEICHRSAGFQKHELDELTEVFHMFDYDSSGEIENLELLDLLRHFGYSTSLEDVHRFLSEADVNANGAMDLQEFYQQMRLHREMELRRSREVFDEHTGASSEELPVAKFATALRALDQVPGETVLQEALASTGSPTSLTFEAFMTASDRCRKRAAAERRQRAGFSQEEFDALREAFSQRCKPGCQELEKGELLWLLMDFGVHVSTLEERRGIFQRLERARQSALKVGVEETKVGAASSPTTVWVFAHFLRAWRCENQEEQMNREEQVIDKARFSRAEVQEFRELFMLWVRKSTSANEETPTSSLPLASMPRRNTLPNTTLGGVGAREQQIPISVSMSAEDEKACLPTKGLHHLVASIGLELIPKQRLELDSKIRQSLPSDDDLIDFATFLLLMRWMLDTNFADINGKAQKVVEKIRKSATPSAASSSPSRLNMRRQSV